MNVTLAYAVKHSSDVIYECPLTWASATSRIGKDKYFCAKKSERLAASIPSCHFPETRASIAVRDKLLISDRGMSFLRSVSVPQTKQVTLIEDKIVLMFKVHFLTFGYLKA